jgi:hypothetical protein
MEEKNTVPIVRIQKRNQVMQIVWIFFDYIRVRIRLEKFRFIRIWVWIFNIRYRIRILKSYIYHVIFICILSDVVILSIFKSESNRNIKTNTFALQSWDQVNWVAARLVTRLWFVNHAHDLSHGETSKRKRSWHESFKENPGAPGRTGVSI